MIASDVFYLLVSQVFDPILVEELGFVFSRSAYSRELGTRLRQIVGYELHQETRETFRLTLGLNSSLIMNDLPADESGSCFVQWLTKSGVQDFPRNWSCHNEATAIRSLTKLEGMIGRTLIPWLDRYRTLTDLAGMLSQDHVEVRQKLLAAEGKRLQRIDEGTPVVSARHVKSQQREGTGARVRDWASQIIRGA